MRFVLSTVLASLFATCLADHIVVKSPQNATTQASGSEMAIAYTVSPDERAHIGSVTVDIFDHEAKNVLYRNVSYAQWSDWHEHGGRVAAAWTLPEDIEAGWYYVIYQGITGGHCSTNGKPIYRICPGVVMSSSMIQVE
ncbi:hypothetical protein K450DRAFT_248846 [Umbelopsis ramanniana AG]|uniref:Uncharacterized protein n=1 Tax=Umbelopsis ramanniana AG TaxID=1314678 RepID=A0AAD5E769_UMBRA|nr:uncharacterized protein K450DRAFT_248846 [Umbelopsis ramanniana AG]KAI8578064.1 hypothetical protein K450DRAFT_248846 [Umbelopsis ramanniana AG]